MNEHIKIAMSDFRELEARYERKLWVRAEQVSLMASVGIYRGEKTCRQEIIFNIAAEVVEPEDDWIGDTIDYRTLVEQARSLTRERHFELIETLIRELAHRLIALERINCVDIELFKPAAIPPAMASVRYRIAKTRREMEWAG
ncbi:dihydroneopterin aldolase [Sphingobium chlorophenolicum]|uniref:Dihydroneopterin aldolase n=1 Tax=Sphingobium chlorophenolicum TaxID=46429 RepID=A0A081R7X8_SPHCR|nr:dihydroneopterin aldolase [Sphingobium chlorophenolicum]KEQ51301.1 Dihydroneopterin aldolase [Sphingobium chlorophenolicum]